MSLPAGPTIDVINGLTEAILVTLTTQRSEERYPSHDADRMDDKIANCKRRAALLRKMRDDFENEMSDQL